MCLFQQPSFKCQLLAEDSSRAGDRLPGNPLASSQTSPTHAEKLIKNKGRASQRSSQLSRPAQVRFPWHSPRQRQGAAARQARAASRVVAASMFVPNSSQKPSRWQGGRFGSWSEAWRQQASREAAWEVCASASKTERGNGQQSGATLCYIHSCFWIISCSTTAPASPPTKLPPLATARTPSCCSPRAS